MIHNWLRRMNGNKETGKRSKSRRAKNCRFRQSLVESLEERTVLSVTVPDIGPLVGSRLSSVETNLIGAVNTLEQIPFVGRQISQLQDPAHNGVNFIDGFVNQLEQTFTSLANTYTTAAARDGAIRTAVFNTLGGGGLNILGDSNGNGLDQNDVVVTDLPNNGFRAEVRLHHNIATVNVPVNFDTGLKSLPFKVTSTGNLQLQVAWDYQLAVTYDGGTAFLDTSAKLSDFAQSTLNNGIDANHEMIVQVSLASTNLVEQAYIGFLAGSISMQGPNALGLIIGVDNIATTPTLTLGGGAEVNLHLAVGFGGQQQNADPANQLVANLPDLGADFHADWHWSGMPGSSPTLNANFHNLGIGLGQFLTKSLEPAISSIQSATRYYEPIIKVLNYPLPGLSDLSHILGDLPPFHGDDVTLFQIAKEVGTFFELDPVFTVIGIANQIIDDINSIKNVIGPNGAELFFTLSDQIDLGNFQLLTAPAATDPTVPGTDPTNMATLTQFDVATLVQSTTTIQDLASSVIDTAPLPTDLKSTLSNKLNHMLTVSEPVKIAYPLFNRPAQSILQLLLGQDADLVSLDLNPELHASLEQATGLSIFGASLNFEGTVDANAHLKMGYDTRGIREMFDQIVNGPSIDFVSDLTDGFYLKDDAIFRANGSIGVSAGASAGIVLHADISGTVNTGDGIYIRTRTSANSDHKLRPSDIVPSVFETHGTVFAGLNVDIAVGVDIPLVGFAGVQHTIPIANTQILDLNGIYDHPPATPVLATVGSSGNVLLLVGDPAAFRHVVSAGNDIGSLAGHSETYQISRYHKDFIDADGNPNSEDGIVISAFGCSQLIKGNITSISGIAAGEDLSVTVDSDVAATIGLYGGSGHAYFAALGSGHAELHAGSQDSTLIGGSGINNLWGGDGNDRLIAGAHTQNMFGYGGTNTFVVKAPFTAGLIFTGAAGNDIVEVNGTDALASLNIAPDPALPTGLIVSGKDPQQRQTLFLRVVASGIGALGINQGGMLTSITVGDTSATNLKRLFVNAFNATRTAPLVVSMAGSVKKDFIDENVVPLPQDRTKKLLLVEVQNLRAEFTGVRPADELHLDGGAGDDTYDLLPNELAPLSIFVHDSGRDNKDRMLIEGQLYSNAFDSGRIEVEADDGLIGFRWFPRPGVFIRIPINLYYFDDSVDSVLLDASGVNPMNSIPFLVTVNRSASRLPLEIDTGTATDTFNIRRPGVGFLTLNGRGSNDTYNITADTGAHQISIRDSGRGDTNSAFLKDQAVTGVGVVQYTLNGSGVRRLISPLIGPIEQVVLSLNNVANLTLDATSRIPNIFTVNGSPVTSSMTINGGNAGNIYNVNATRGGIATTLNAGTGTDVVSIVESLASIIQGALAGTVQVNGGGSTSVIWDDRQVTSSTYIGTVPYLLGPSVYLFGDGSVQRITTTEAVSNGVPVSSPRARVTYQNVTSVTLDDAPLLAFGTDQFQVNSTSGADTVNIDVNSAGAHVYVGSSGVSLDNVSNLAIQGHGDTQLSVDDEAKGNQTIPVPDGSTIAVQLMGDLGYHIYADAITRSVLERITQTGPNGNVISDAFLNPTSTIHYQGIAALDIKGGRANTDCTVDSTGASMATTFSPGAGILGVLLGEISPTGTSYDLSDIKGHVTVNGSGRSSVQLDDEADEFKSGTYQITDSSTAYTANLGQHIVGRLVLDYSALTGLQVRTGGPRNTLRVSNLAALPLVISDGIGQDTITVGNAISSLDNISRLSVFGHTGTTLTLDNEAAQDAKFPPLFDGVGFDVTTIGYNARFAVTQSQVLFTDLVVVTDEYVIRARPPINPVSSTQAVAAQIDYSGIGRLAIISASSEPLSQAGVPLDSGGSPSVFTVRSTAAVTPVTIAIGAGDTANVGSAANTLDAIQSDLSINGRDGNTTLNLHDEGTAAREEYDVYADRVDREPFSPGEPAPPPTQTIHYSGIANLNVHGGAYAFGDAYYALGTPTGTSVALYAGGGRSNEFIIETTGGNLDGIHGPVAVHGVSIYDVSVVYDYGNSSAHTYTLSAPDAVTSVLQRDGLAAITQDGIGEMILYVPVVGGNHVNVQGLPAGLYANLTTSNGDVDTVGNPTPNGPLTMVGIYGTVSFSFEAPTVTAPVQLSVDDSGDVSTSISPCRVSLGLDYADSSGFTWVNNLSGNNDWVGWNLPAGSSVTVRGRVNGNETFAIKPTRNSIAPTLQASGSNNALDYSAYTGYVTVNLARDTATALAEISGIQNVTGGQGNNLLVGDANANRLIGGTGRNILLGGLGSDTLDASQSQGDNILIGGRTDWDQNQPALDAIMAEWESGNDFGTRRTNITSGVTGSDGNRYALVGGQGNDRTVLDDGAIDTLTCTSNPDPNVVDWLFTGNLDQIVGSKPTDLITPLY